MAEDHKTEISRLFCETAKNIYDGEIARAASIDDKAFKIATVSGILMALVPFFIHFAPQRNSYEFILCAAVLMLFLISQLGCWIYLFKTVFPIRIPKIAVQSITLNENITKSPDDVYKTFYDSYQVYIGKLQCRNKRKVKFLKYSLYALLLSFGIYFILAILLILTNSYALFKSLNQ